MDLDKFFLDLDEDEIAKRNAEKEAAQTAEAEQWVDTGECDGGGCKI